MALASNALATVSSCRDYMRVVTTSDDRLIESLINAVSSRIEKITGRVFVTATHREWPDVRELDTITLKNWPVTSVTRLAYGRKTGLTVNGSTSTDLRATVEVQDDQLVLTRYDSSGTVAATTLTFVTYPTTGGLATQVTATTGWTGTAGTNSLTADLHRMGGQDALGRTVDLTYPDTSDLDYRVDETRGLIFVTGRTWDRGWVPPDPLDTLTVVNEHHSVLVEYTAGYIGHGTTSATTLPENLQQVCREIVHRAFTMGEHDPNLTSESLEAYSYSLADQTLTDDTLRDQLSFWRDYR